MKRLILVALLACGSRPPVGPAGGTTGEGPASGVDPTGTACEPLRGKVEQLYRAEAAKARAPDPARVNEAIADNTTMVMNDCVQAPGKATACITAATTVRELEARCLIPIDDEGTEGDQLAH